MKSKTHFSVKILHLKWKIRILTIFCLHHFCKILWIKCQILQCCQVQWPKLSQTLNWNYEVLEKFTCLLKTRKNQRPLLAKPYSITSLIGLTTCTTQNTTTRKCKVQTEKKLQIANTILSLDVKTLWEKKFKIIPNHLSKKYQILILKNYLKMLKNFQESRNLQSLIIRNF